MILYSSNSDAVKNVWLASKTMYSNRLLFVRVVLTVYSLSSVCCVVFVTNKCVHKVHRKASWTGLICHTRQKTKVEKGKKHAHSLSPSYTLQHIMTLKGEKRSSTASTLSTFLHVYLLTYWVVRKTGQGDDRTCKLLFNIVNGRAYTLLFRG